MNQKYGILNKFFFSILGILASLTAIAQGGVGIGTTKPQAALDVSSTTGGFLPPRMSFEQRSKLTPLVAGLIIYQEDHIPGLYLYNGTIWVLLDLDNLGDHNATKRLNLQDQLLVGADGASGQPGSTGLRVNGSGQVGIGTTTPESLLQIGAKDFEQPAFLKIGAGNGVANREWELGVNVNTSNFSDVSGENYDFSIRDATENATRLLIDYKNGNVGIGSVTPTEKLDVAGSVKVSEKLEAKALTSETVESEHFKYKFPKAHVLTIPATAFVSWRPGTYFANIEKAAVKTNEATMIPGGVYLSGGTLNQSGYLSAPVILPQSAKITGLTLLGVCTSSTVLTSLELSAIRLLKNTAFAMQFTGEVTLPVKIDTIQSANTALNHTVDNNLNIYQLTATLNQNSNSTQIVSVSISYTLDEPD